MIINRQMIYNKRVSKKDILISNIAQIFFEKLDLRKKERNGDVI